MVILALDRVTLSHSVHQLQQTALPPRLLQEDMPQQLLRTGSLLVVEGKTLTHEIVELGRPDLRLLEAIRRMRCDLSNCLDRVEVVLGGSSLCHLDQRYPQRPYISA